MRRAFFETLPGLLSASVRTVTASHPLALALYIYIASSRKTCLTQLRPLSAAVPADKAMAPTPKLAPADLPNPYAHELCAPHVPVRTHRVPCCIAYTCMHGL